MAKCWHKFAAIGFFLQGVLAFYYAYKFSQIYGGVFETDKPAWWALVAGIFTITAAMNEAEKGWSGLNKAPNVGTRST